MTFKEFYNKKDGGNAIPNAVRIYQDNFDVTINDVYNNLLPKFGLGITDVCLLGSSGKKESGETSGDIDLGINVNKIIKSNNLKDFNEVFDFICSQLKHNGYIYNDLRSIGLISVSWPISSVVGEYDQTGKVVQLDLMPTDNLEWVYWAYYSPSQKESMYKGLYRNELLYAIAKYMNYEVLKTDFDKNGIKVDVEWSRNFFDLSNGLMTGVQTNKGKTGITKNVKTLYKQLVSKNPNEVVDMMFGKFYVPFDILTWDDVINAINSSNFPYKNQRENILRMATKGLIKKGAPVPKEVQQYV